FPAQPALDPRAAAAHRPGCRRARLRARPGRREGVPRPVPRAAPAARRGLPARGQAVPDARRGLHRGQAPLGGDGRGAGPAAGRRGAADQGGAPRPGTGVRGPRAALLALRAGGSGWRCAPARRGVGFRSPHERVRRGGRMSGPRVVCLGGGHGLAASLGAMRRLTPYLTAVVTVADDGGSSGRIRRELSAVPPRDLRMALAALAGEGRRSRLWAEALRHRFGGSGALAGHPIGNLVITGLAEMFGWDTVQALEATGRLVGAVGRVLPMSDVPLEIAAEVTGLDQADPAAVRRIR